MSAAVRIQRKPREKQDPYWSQTPLGKAAGAHPDRSVVPDPDYVRDLEMADSQYAPVAWADIACAAKTGALSRRPPSAASRCAVPRRVC